MSISAIGKKALSPKAQTVMSNALKLRKELVPILQKPLRELTPREHGLFNKIFDAKFAKRQVVNLEGIYKVVNNEIISSGKYLREIFKKIKKVK